MSPSKITPISMIGENRSFWEPINKKDRTVRNSSCPFLYCHVNNRSYSKNNLVHVDRDSDSNLEVIHHEYSQGHACAAMKVAN
jgi:hypothetical protein